jgi:hypothetical protein
LNPDGETTRTKPRTLLSCSVAKKIYTSLDFANVECAKFHGTILAESIRPKTAEFAAKFATELLKATGGNLRKVRCKPLAWILTYHLFMASSRFIDMSGLFTVIRKYMDE